MQRKNKRILLAIFKATAGTAKAIWRSSLSVLYLIVYSYLLFALLSYYKIDHSAIESFLASVNFLIDTWKVFWVAFFLSNIYNEWKYFWRRWR